MRSGTNGLQDPAVLGATAAAVRIPPSAPSTLLRVSPAISRARVPWVTAGAFFLISVVVAVVAASLSARLSEERAERREVEEVAGEVATDLLTYDYRDLDGWKSRVLANATKDFRATFEATFAESLVPIVTEVQATSAARVNNVFLGAIGEKTAKAIVVVDTVAGGPAGERAGPQTYIEIDLVEVGPRWLANNVTDLNVARAADSGNGTPPPTVQGPNG